jgi:hypothetical protein
VVRHTLQFALFIRELSQHVVEDFYQFDEFMVFTLARNALIKSFGGDPVGGRDKFFQGAHDSAGKTPATNTNQNEGKWQGDIKSIAYTLHVDVDDLCVYGNCYSGAVSACQSDAPDVPAYALRTER